MMIRSANAYWEGTLQEGQGRIRFGNNVFDQPYSFTSRFGEGQGTNPEELIGAAHAGCFSMALAHGLQQTGFAPRRIETTADVHLEQQDGGYAITAINLNTQGDVPGMDEKTFIKRAQQAAKNCPVSRAMKGVKITVDARLLQEATTGAG